MGIFTLTSSSIYPNPVNLSGQKCSGQMKNSADPDQTAP